MSWLRKDKPKPANSDLLVLQSASFAMFCAQHAVAKYDAVTCGAEFMKWGLALMTGLPLETASAQVAEMLADHDAKIKNALLAHADTTKRN
ncbi:MAG TPA: hypothetical protein VNR39_12175 [Pseudolabrys sp.]|nr:hypothetical protein [Pseudolabrys sp.]